MDASELNGNPTPQRRQTFAGWTEHGHRLPDPFRLEVQMRIDHEESLCVLRLERQGPQIICPGGPRSRVSTKTNPVWSPTASHPNNSTAVRPNPGSNPPFLYNHPSPSR